MGQFVNPIASSFAGAIQGTRAAAAERRKSDESRSTRRDLADEFRPSEAVSGVTEPEASNAGEGGRGLPHTGTEESREDREAHGSGGEEPVRDRPSIDLSA